MSITIISRLIPKHHKRLFSLSPPKYSFSFYDLVKETPTNPKLSIEAYHLTDNDIKKLQKKGGTAFEGNYQLDSQSPEEKIARVFGGRIKGENKGSTSRVIRGEPKNICGVMVPDKPLEPDNCCMSGCVNCVWQIFDEDIKEWNRKREKAAKMLSKKGGRWPENFHAPLKLLKVENMPPTFARKAKEGKLKTTAEEDDTTSNDAAWDNIPIYIKVFAQTEEKMKARNRARALAKASGGSKAEASS